MNQLQLAEITVMLAVCGLLLGALTILLLPILRRVQTSWQLATLSVLLGSHIAVAIVVPARYLVHSGTANTDRSSLLAGHLAPEELSVDESSAIKSATSTPPGGRFIQNVNSLQGALHLPASLAVLFGILGPVWAVGFLLLLSYWIGQSLQLRKLVNASESVRLTRYDVGPSRKPHETRPRLCISNSPVAAFCGGIISPFIVVSRNLFDALAPGEFRMLIRHEMAHLRAGDAILLHIQFIATACFWWLPTVWLASRRLTHACEKRCDSEVSRTGVAPEDYASFLLRVAAFHPSSSPTNTLPVSRQFNETKSRIRTILMNTPARDNHSSITQRTLTAIIALIGLGLLVQLGSYVTIADEKDEPPGSAPVDAVVVIDAGHGGHDNGGKVGGATEKDVTLIIAKKLDAALKRQGLKTVMTRETDRFVPLKRRAELSNASAADCFISLHTNLSNKDILHGIELYSPKTKKHTGSEQFSQRLATALKSIDSKPVIAPKRADFIVLTDVNCPRILAELGFLSNLKDRQRLLNEAYQDQLVTKLANGIIKFVGEPEK